MHFSKDIGYPSLIEKVVERHCLDWHFFHVAFPAMGGTMGEGAA